MYQKISKTSNDDIIWALLLKDPFLEAARQGLRVFVEVLLTKGAKVDEIDPMMA